jgi:hypothetical protein
MRLRFTVGAVLLAAFVLGCVSGLDITVTPGRERCYAEYVDTVRARVCVGGGVNVSSVGVVECG